jgi:hypothetical protein
VHFLKSIATNDLNPTESPTVLWEDVCFGFLFFVLLPKQFSLVICFLTSFQKNCRYKATDGWEGSFTTSPGPSEILLATQTSQFLTNLQSISSLFFIAKLYRAWKSPWHILFLPK